VGNVARRLGDLFLIRLHHKRELLQTMASNRGSARIRFGLRTLLAATCLVALLFNFIIAPDIKRTSTFKQLEQGGVIIYAPMVVMFGGLQPIPHVTPKPTWFAMRQWINNRIGIETVPWHSGEELEMPPGAGNRLHSLVRTLDDLTPMLERQVIRNGG
jgi:hypothetical protein